MVSDYLTRQPSTAFVILTYLLCILHKYTYFPPMCECFLNLCNYFISDQIDLVEAILSRLTIFSSCFRPSPRSFLFHITNRWAMHGSGYKQSCLVGSSPYVFKHGKHSKKYQVANNYLYVGISKSLRNKILLNPINVIFGVAKIK